MLFRSELDKKFRVQLDRIEGLRASLARAQQRRTAAAVKAKSLQLEAERAADEELVLSMASEEEQAALRSAGDELKAEASEVEGGQEGGSGCPAGWGGCPASRHGGGQSPQGVPGELGQRGSAQIIRS